METIKVTYKNEVTEVFNLVQYSVAGIGWLMMNFADGEQKFINRDIIESFRTIRDREK